MKHSIVIAVIGVIVFVGAGVVLASSSNCKLGPAGTPEEEYNDTNRRNDDYSWFTHFVCISNMKLEHGR